MNLRYHIIIDIIINWLLVIFGTIAGLYFSIFYIIYSIPLYIWFSLRTLKWIRVLVDVIFSRPQKLITKLYRCSYKERVYALDLSKKIQYSVLLFNDNRLKGRYIFLKDFEYKLKPSGAFVVNYYPKSKFIISIETINE